MEVYPSGLALYLVNGSHLLTQLELAFLLLFVCLFFCLRAIFRGTQGLLLAQESLLVVPRGTYGMLVIEPMSATCKADPSSMFSLSYLPAL